MVTLLRVKLSAHIIPKVEITAWVDDQRAEEVISRMVESARTGRMGDGKIFVLGAESHETVLASSKSGRESPK